MMTADVPETTREYVREHRDDLAYILRHSSDPYLRACAGALLIRGGSSPDVEQVKQELDRMTEVA